MEMEIVQQFQLQVLITPQHNGVTYWTRWNIQGSCSSITICNYYNMEVRSNIIKYQIAQ